MGQRAMTVIFVPSKMSARWGAAKGRLRSALKRRRPAQRFKPVTGTPASVLNNRLSMAAPAMTQIRAQRKTAVSLGHAKVPRSSNAFIWSHPTSLRAKRVSSLKSENKTR